MKTKKKPLTGDEIKRQNKRKCAEHWKNGREKYNSKP